MTASSNVPTPATPTLAGLAEGVDRLAHARVLVVGDAMLDRYWFGRVNRMSPEAPVPVLTMATELDEPGGAGNVVHNLAALGAAAAFVSVVGDDPAGAELTGLIGAATMTSRLLGVARELVLAALFVGGLAVVGRPPKKPLQPRAEIAGALVRQLPSRPRQHRELVPPLRRGKDHDPSIGQFSKTRQGRLQEHAIQPARCLPLHGQ